MKTNVQKCSIILLLVTLATVFSVFCFVPAIPQEADYHHFANDHAVLSISNFYNVVSNAGFIICGIWGLIVLKRCEVKSKPVWVLCIGMVLTGLGSAYYHYHPQNETLVWDRLPMVLVFSSFFAEVYARYFGQKQAQRIWMLTLSAGLISIVYWYYTESIGKGDLRLYAIVQFLPMLLISIMVIVFRDRNKALHVPLLATFLFYVAAKFFEHYDHAIFSQTHFIGGHCIKHVLASFATACIVWMITGNYKDSLIKTP